MEMYHTFLLNEAKRFQVYIGVACKLDPYCLTVIGSHADSTDFKSALVRIVSFFVDCLKQARFDSREESRKGVRALD